MEDILHLYMRPYDPNYPVVCIDELPCVLHGETVMPLPMKSGKVLREHYEYERIGLLRSPSTCSLFVALEPLTGYRMVMVSRHRKQGDYTRFMQQVADHYKDARRIEVVQDNLNTHQAGSFYTVLAPDAAWALSQRFSFHYTPKKGSWLNMAEIELSVITRQCLARRIPSMKVLEREIEQLVKERNAEAATVNWQFTPEKARSKLQRHYDEVQLRYIS